MIRHHVLVLACLLAAFLVASTCLVGSRTADTLSALLPPVVFAPSGSGPSALGAWRSRLPLS